MDEDFASVLNRVFYKSVRESEVFFGVFFVFIMQVNVEVFEILCSFGVLFGGDIEYVGDSQFEQVFGFEPGDKVAVEKLGSDLNRVEALQKAVAQAPAKSRMGETVTVQFLLIVLVGFGSYSVRLVV